GAPGRAWAGAAAAGLLASRRRAGAALMAVRGSSGRALRGSSRRAGAVITGLRGSARRAGAAARPRRGSHTREAGAAASAIPAAEEKQRELETDAETEYRRADLAGDAAAAVALGTLLAERGD